LVLEKIQQLPSDWDNLNIVIAKQGGFDKYSKSCEQEWQRTFAGRKVLEGIRIAYTHEQYTFPDDDHEIELIGKGFATGFSLLLEQTENMLEQTASSGVVESVKVYTVEIMWGWANDDHHKPRDYLFSAEGAGFEAYEDLDKFYYKLEDELELSEDDKTKFRIGFGFAAAIIVHFRASQNISPSYAQDIVDEQVEAATANGEVDDFIAKILKSG